MPNDKLPKSMTKSKMEQFDDALLAEIDTAILEGRGALWCLKILSANYKGPLVLPGRSSVNKWIMKRRKVLRVEEFLEAKKVIANLPPVPDLRTIDLTDSRATLDAIEKAFAERIEIIRGRQGVLADPRLESIISMNLAEMRATTVKKIELDSKMGFDRTRLKAIADTILLHLSNTIVQAYRDVHSDDRLQNFSKALSQRLELLPFDVIEAEISAVAKNPNPGVVTIEGKKL